MWILAWLTATPVRVVRAALKRVEEGDLRGDLVVFDGTELGELQRGFNSMVDGLRERERVRDSVRPARGPRSRPCRRTGQAGARRRRALCRSGFRRHHRLDAAGDESARRGGRAAAQPVLRGHRRGGRSAPRTGQQVRGRRGAGGVRRAQPSRPTRRAGARRGPRDRPSSATSEVPECKAGIGVTAGNAVAGNVGAKERFEYTVIGEPVNEAARLCELAKNEPHRLVGILGHRRRGRAMTSKPIGRWAKRVTLRGHDQPTQLAAPV